MPERIPTSSALAIAILTAALIGGIFGAAAHATAERSPADDLRERLALVAMERAACMEACGTPEACQRCADVAQERIEGETSLVLEGIERTQPKP